MIRAGRAPLRSTLALALAAALAGGACGDARQEGSPAPSAATPERVVEAPRALPGEDLYELPGELGEQHEPALASSLAARRVADDDWESEEFAQRAGARLHELEAWLTSDAPELGAELEAWIDPGVRVGALWWPGEGRTRSPSGLVVRRPPAPSAAPRSGRAALREALAELRGDARGARLDDVHFKLVGVDLQAMPLRLSAICQTHGTQGSRALGQQGDWELEWGIDARDGGPLLVGVTVGAFQEVLGREDGALFGEISEAVLGGTRAWSGQLTTGLESWSGRIDRSLGVSLIGHHGLALGDVDEDGLEDLYVCQPAGLPNLLFLRRPGGAAEERAASASVDYLDSSRSALLLDLDGDGHQDLALDLDPLFVLHAGDGAAHFRGVLQMETPATTSLCAADYDLDGDLDLYLCGYLQPDSAEVSPLPYHDARNGKPNRLLRNDCGPDGWDFREVTREVGLDVNNRRFSLAAAWEDFDDDGDSDLYVANDFGRNNLYRNDGGRFTDVAAEAGVEDMAAGMGVTWADHDHDGDLDLYVSNMFSSAGGRVTFQRRFKEEDDEAVRDAYRRHARGNSLFENLGDGSFRDVSVEAGVTRGRWAWGSIFCDLDGDGWRDLFVPNGFVTGSNPEDL